MMRGLNPSYESVPVKVDADGSLNVNLKSTGAVTIEVNEADLANVGAKADAAATTDTGTFSILAFIKRSMQNWTTIIGLFSNPAVVTGNITAAVAAPTLVADLIANTKQSISGGTVDVVTIRINSIAGGAATGTVNFFGTDDGVNLFPVSGLPIGGAIGSGSFVNSAAAPGAWQVKGSAARTIYAVATAIGAGATVNVSLSATPNQSRVTAILRGSLGGGVSAAAGTIPTESVAIQASPRVVFTANIANGASLSAALALGNCTAARIGMPAVVTGSGTTTLTFQTSHDGVTYKDFYDEYGNEYTVAAGKVTQGRSYKLPLADFASIPYLKVRLGTSASPQAQGQSTDLVVTGVV
jgi:hypothetical protein